MRFCDVRVVMGIFRRKKDIRERPLGVSPCPHCGSNNTRLSAGYGSEQPDYVRVWRGQRALACRCLDCGSEFYAEGQPGEIPDFTDEGRIIEDELALREAEEEIARQIEEDQDHRYR